MKVERICAIALRRGADFAPERRFFTAGENTRRCSKRAVTKKITAFFTVIFLMSHQ